MARKITDGEREALKSLQCERDSRLASKKELHRADAEIGGLRAQLSRATAEIAALKDCLRAYEHYNFGGKPTEQSLEAAWNALLAAVAKLKETQEV